jgi:NADH-quinone oxidoreductase subunit A
VSPVYEPYLVVVLVSILVVGIAGSILLLNFWLGPRRPTHIKGLPYESGVDPADNPRHRFSVKFYLTAILFLVFDLEVVFLYPWAAKYLDFLKTEEMAGVALAAMLVFIAELGLGFVYVLKRGALSWE